MSAVQQQVDEVKGIMTQNIEKVLERGEKLDDLLDKTEELESSVSNFKMNLITLLLIKISVWHIGGVRFSQCLYKFPLFFSQKCSKPQQEEWGKSIGGKTQKWQSVWWWWLLLLL